MSSSSDEEHRAALRSVAIDSRSVVAFANPATSSSRRARTSKSSKQRHGRNDDEDALENDSNDGTPLKLYQIRVQDLLHQHLDKCFGNPPVRIAEGSNPHVETSDRLEKDQSYDGETRLFSNTSVGIALKRKAVPKGPRPRVRIRPALYDSSDELSAEQDSRFEAVAIEGTTVTAQAEAAQAKAHARFIASEMVSQDALQAEVVRVALLRKERGEKWLPAVAKDMVKEIKAESERRKGISEKGIIGTVHD